MPPMPTRAVTSYGPRRVPGARDILCVSDLASTDTLTELLERLGLARCLAELDRVEPHRAGQARKESAARCLDVGATRQLIHVDVFQVVPPNLWHTERRIDGELAQGFIGRVDLDHDVRRGIGFEIDRAPADHPMRVGHVKTGVRLDALLNGPALPRGRSAWFERQVQFF